MATLKDWAVLYFPIHYLDDRNIGLMELTELTPQEQYKLWKELSELSEEDDTIQDDYGEDIVVGAEMDDVFDLESQINDEDFLYWMKNYYAIFVEKSEVGIEVL